jgi:DNA-binding HxlR family transcriptional regulator
MNNRLLKTSKKILCLLFDKNLHVNEIIRQTSPDRSYIISTIKTLEREGLIARNKRTKKGKEIVKQLTEVGHELVDVSRSLEQWKRSYFELRKAYWEKLIVNVDSGDDRVIKSILKNRGLSDEEINLYDDTKTGVSLMLYSCKKDVMDTVVCRYAFILSKFSLSDTAKNILYDIIRDAAVFQLSQDEGDINIKNPFENSEAERLLDDMAEDMACPVPVIMHDEIKNVTICRLSLLGIRKERVEKKLEKSRWFRLRLQLHDQQHKRAVDFFKEYINKLPS